MASGEERKHKEKDGEHKKKWTRLKQKDRMIAVAQKKEQDKAGGWERAAASQLRSDMTEREREVGGIEGEGGGLIGLGGRKP